MPSVLCSICQERKLEIPNQKQLFLSDFRLLGLFSPQRTGKILLIRCFKINVTNMFFKKSLYLLEILTEIFRNDRASQICFKLTVGAGKVELKQDWPCVDQC